jgi:hypothetical protein
MCIYTLQLVAKDRFWSRVDMQATSAARLLTWASGSFLKILYYVVFIPSWNPECLDPILNQGVQEGISYLAEGNY